MKRFLLISAIITPILLLLATGNYLFYQHQLLQKQNQNHQITLQQAQKIFRSLAQSHTIKHSAALVDSLFPQIAFSVTDSAGRIIYRTSRWDPFTALSAQHSFSLNKRRITLLLRKSTIPISYSLWIAVALSLVLVALLSVIITARFYKKPLETVKKMVHQASSGNFSPSVTYDRKDEFTDTFIQLKRTFERVSMLNQSYQKAQQRIATMLKVVDESLIMLDAKGKLQLYNESAQKLLHCPERVPFPKYFQQLISQNPPLDQFIRQGFQQSPDLLEQELAVWLPDQSDLLIRIQAQALKSEQRFMGLLLSLKDVRMLKELHKNLQRSMKFSILTNLASSISHELKNPLSAMAIHAEVLANRIRKLALPEEKKIVHSVNVLQNEIKRLNRIIHQFFSLARSKQEDLTLININALLKDVLFLVQQQAVERDITLEVNLQPHLSYVLGDSDQLKQVFLNIIINAFQAIGQKGLVRVTSFQQGGRIFVTVEDNGQGMPPEVQQRVFDLYYTTKSDGSGIGLAISQKIVQAHDGRISFDSEPGKGTLFKLDFPARDPSNHAHWTRSQQKT